MMDKQKREMNVKSNVTFIDRFAGIGGMRLAYRSTADIAYTPTNGIITVSRLISPILMSGLGRVIGFEEKTQGTLFFDICRNNSM